MNAGFFHGFHNLKINNTVKVLIMSYSTIWVGWGMISPILAVSMVDNIQGAGLETVGFAISIYMLTKSFVQIPVARYLDLKKGERDEFFALFAGSLLLAVAAFGYANIQTIAALYIFQVVYGIADGLICPSWSSLFATHTDRTSMATEYSIYYTTVDLIGAMAASFGALMVAAFGYRIVFILVACLSFLGALTLLPMYRDLKKTPH